MAVFSCLWFWSRSYIHYFQLDTNSYICRKQIKFECRQHDINVKSGIIEICKYLSFDVFLV